MGKLTKEMVSEIRASKGKVTQKELARKFDVHESAISLTQRGERNGNPDGRPSIYSPELVQELLTRLETRFLSDVCKDEDMPTYTTVCRWQRDKDGLGALMRAARKQLYDLKLSSAAHTVDTCDETNWKSARVKGEFFMRMAERVLPEYYGTQTKSDVNVTITKIVFSEEQKDPPLPKPIPPVLPAETIPDADFEDSPPDSR